MNLQAILSSLLGLLGPGFIPQSISSIVTTILGAGGGTIQADVLRVANQRLDQQVGRTSGKELARSLIKEIDAAMDEESLHMPGMTVDQRVELGKALAGNVAYRMAQAAALIADYPAGQEAVVRAKAAHADLTGPREARHAKVLAAEQAFIDIGRVGAGETP